MSRAIIPLMVERDSGQHHQHREHCREMGLPKGRSLQCDEVRGLGSERRHEHRPRWDGTPRFERGPRPYGDGVQRGCVSTETRRGRAVCTRTPNLLLPRTSLTPSNYVANTPAHVDVINLVIMPTVQRHAMILQRDG